MGPLRCFARIISAMPFRLSLSGPIDFFAEDEHHHVGVLLNRSRFAKIAEHRPVIAVPVSGARLSCEKTRNGTRRSFDISFRPRDSELISCTRFSNAPRPCISCKIVDHDQAQIVFRLQAGEACECTSIRLVPAVSSMNSGDSTYLHGGFLQHAALILIQVAGPELLLIHARRRADHTGQQRFLRHFEREDRHGFRIPRVRRDVLRDIQRKRSFAHGRPRGQDEQFAFAQAARHFIELQKSRADAFDALAGVEERVDAAFEIRR